MQIDFLILADAVQAVNGKLYMLGGAWDRYSWPAYPAPVHIGIAIGILVEWHETNQEHTVEVLISDADGKPVIPNIAGKFEAGRPPGITQGSQQRVILAVNADFQLPAPGRYQVRAVVDSIERPVTFEARLSTPPR